MIEYLSTMSETSIEETNQGYLNLKRRFLNSSIYMTSTKILVISTPNLNNKWFYSEYFQQNLKVMPVPTFAQIPLWPRIIKEDFRNQLEEIGVEL